MEEDDEPLKFDEIKAESRIIIDKENQKYQKRKA